MAETTIVTTSIASRDIQVKLPTETQLILMGRAAKHGQRAFLKQEIVEGIYNLVDALDIVDSLIVEQDDREFLIGLMSRGELEIDELLNAIKESTPEEEAEAKPIKATRVTRASRAKK